MAYPEPTALMLSLSKHDMRATSVAGGAQAGDAVGQPLLQDPDVARIADEVEAGAEQRRALGDRGAQPAERLVVGAAGGGDAGDRLLEGGILEITRPAERGGEVDMADPQPVDTRQRCDRLDILDPGPGLDLGEVADPPVG